MLFVLILVMSIGCSMDQKEDDAYEFAEKMATGHVVVLKKGSSYIVNEASNSVNPYEGLSKDVIQVYAGPFGYLYYLDNGMLMDLRTNEEVDPANVRRYKIEELILKMK